MTKEKEAEEESRKIDQQLATQHVVIAGHSGSMHVQLGFHSNGC
jgi:hypothetical protein